VEQWAEIRRMHFVQGLSIKRIAQRTGRNRKTIRRAVRSPDGNGGLNWPHRGGLNWPHLRPTCHRPFEAHRARAGGGGRNGITSGAVRADQARP
jgi:hypothetical protein